MKYPLNNSRQQLNNVLSYIRYAEGILCLSHAGKPHLLAFRFFFIEVRRQPLLESTLLKVVENNQLDPH